MKNIISFFILLTCVACSNEKSSSNEKSFKGELTLTPAESALLYFDRMVELSNTKVEKEALRQEAIKDWHKMQIRINKKYFTKEELIEVIKFFSTDVGKKMNKNMSTIMQEGYSQGYEWGLQFGNKIRELINKKREEKN